MTSCPKCTTEMWSTGRSNDLPPYYCQQCVTYFDFTEGTALGEVSV